MIVAQLYEYADWKPSELCMLRGNILWCVNYISLKLLLQNFKQNIHRREEIDQLIMQLEMLNPLLIIV